MKPSLAPGVTIVRRVTVDRSRTIDFMGEEGRVYATPAMIMDMEITCRQAMLEHLDPGEDSVGARVEFDHLAPTLLGMTVEIKATIVEVKGRLVTFEATVHDSVEQAGRGRHVRFVVDIKKTAERLKAKAAKSKPAQ